MGGCSHKLLPPVTPGADPGCPKIHDIFISHHHSSDPKDLLNDVSQHFAEWIYEVCVRLGLKTFLDKTNLSRILNEQGLRTEVFSSHALVAIVSKDGLIDPNGMQQELIWAHNGAIPIVPFYDGDRFSPEAYASWQREFAFALKRPPVVYHRSLHLRAERALLEAVHKALKDAPGSQLPQELVTAIQRMQAKAKRAAAVAAAGSNAEAEPHTESTKSQRQTRQSQPVPAPAIRSTSTTGRVSAEADSRTVRVGTGETPKRFRFEEGLKDGPKEAEGGVARLMKSLREFTAAEEESERKPLFEASADQPGPFTPRHKTLKPTRGILKGSNKPPELKAGGKAAKNSTIGMTVPRVVDKQMEQGIARLREYLGSLRKTDTAQLPTVLRVLQLMQPNEEITKCALASVFEFVQDTAACRQVVAQLGGIKSIIEVMTLHSQNTTLQTYGCGCLYALSCFRPDNPQKDNNSAIIAHSGGIGRLTDAMVTFPIVHEVQQWGVGALRHLAVEIGNNRREVSDGGEVQLTMRSINKRMIAKTGGIELIAKAMLRFPDDVDLQENGCAALCNLTSNRQDNKVRAARAGCIRAAISAMRTFASEPDLMQLACALLRSLALGVPENKIAIVAQGGVRELCQAMAKNRNNPEVNAQAVAALCNLTSQVAANKHAICQAGGLELAVAALRAMPSNVELQQQGCGLLHNLACEPTLKAQVCAAGGAQVADLASESADRSVQQLGALLRQQLHATCADEKEPSEVAAETSAKDPVGKRRRRGAPAQEETDEASAGINGLFTLRKPGSRGAQSKALTRPQRKVMADLLESMREDPSSWLPNNNSSDEAKASAESSPVQSEASEGWGATRRNRAAGYGVEDLEGLSERSRLSEGSRPSVGSFDFFVRRPRTRKDGEAGGSARDSEGEVDTDAAEGRAQSRAVTEGPGATVAMTPAGQALELERQPLRLAREEAEAEGEAEAEAEEEEGERLDGEEVEEIESQASGRDLDTVSQVSSEASDNGWVDIFEDSDATKRIRRRIRRELRREATGGEGAALLDQALNEERLELERQVELERQAERERARAARMKKSKSQVVFAKALRGCGEAPPERWEDILRLQAKAAKRSPLKVAVADSAAAAAALRDGLDGLARNAAKGIGRTRQKASAGLEAVGSVVADQLQTQRPELEDDEGSIFGIDGLRELGEAEVALLDALGEREDAQPGGSNEQLDQNAKAGDLQALSTRLEQRREERRRVKLL